MHIQFSTLHDFIFMGRHGAYVWSAWLISLVALLILLLGSFHARSQFKREWLRQQRVMTARQNSIDLRGNSHVHHD